MAAVREVQEAGYWFSLYSYVAQETEITGISGFPLTLYWVDFETSEEHEIVFSLNDTLQVSYNPAETGTIPEFEFINPDETNCKFSGGSAFSLPDVDDAFNITGEAAPDGGRITVSQGSISASTTGGATCAPVTGGWAWNTTTTGDTITITATSAGTEGSWTSETKAAMAAITADSGATSATLSDGTVLIFTVTATVGTGQQEVSESRVYKVVPKPAS
jgi:hypothetical protein